MDFNSIIVSLLANLVWAVLGALVLYVSKLVFRVYPARNLWQLNDPKTLTLCAATSTETDTGEYLRPTTGLGQVKALVVISTSLYNAYAQDVNIRNILFSDDQIRDRIEHDLILLGGPKNNKVTKYFLDRIKDLNIVEQVDSEITWKIGYQKFQAEIKNRGVVLDYGLIIRMKNPFGGNGKIILFSGAHTFGVTAAASYFVNVLQKDLDHIRRGNSNVAIIVKCRVVDRHPTAIELCKKHFF